MKGIPGSAVAGVVLRFVIFLGVALALWAWRGRMSPEAPSARRHALVLPPAVFAVVWPLIYLCLAAACVLMRRHPAARALVLLAVALTWAWIVVRPASATAAFLIIVAAIATLLAAAGLSRSPAATALAAPPIAWLVAALVLSSTQG